MFCVEQISATGSWCSTNERHDAGPRDDALQGSTTVSTPATVHYYTVHYNTDQGWTPDVNIRLLFLYIVCAFYSRYNTVLIANTEIG